jgi:hypothetical protein
VALALVTAGVLPAASSVGASPTSRDTPSAITYTKQTVEIPSSTITSQLLTVSADQSTYTFKSKSGSLGKLKAGSVMLLQDIAVRDVTKVASSHGHLVVSTTPAALTDLISSGTLSWDAPIDFSKGFVLGGSAVPAGSIADLAGGLPSVATRFGMQPLTASSSITLKGKTDSYDYSIKFTTESKSVAVAITISKSSPVDVDATITGTLDNITSTGKIAISKGKLTSANAVAKNLAGSFTLGYSAKPISQFGLGSAGGIKITLRGEIAVPFVIGPIPFFLGIKVAFFAEAGFSGFNQELSGEYKISYDGNGGFSTSSSGATTSAGVLKGIGDIILKAANAVKTGPISFIFGAQMPEIDLGLGVKGLDVAGNITLVGSSGIATYGSGCDTRQLEGEGVAGATASFFGFSTNLASATLFDKKIQASYPSGCGTFPNEPDGQRGPTPLG